MRGKASSTSTCTLFLVKGVWRRVGAQEELGIVHCALQKLLSVRLGLQDGQAVIVRVDPALEQRLKGNSKATFNGRIRVPEFCHYLKAWLAKKRCEENTQRLQTSFIAIVAEVVGRDGRPNQRSSLALP